MAKFEEKIVLCPRIRCGMCAYLCCRSLIKLMARELEPNAFVEFPQEKKGESLQNLIEFEERIIESRREMSLSGRREKVASGHR